MMEKRFPIDAHDFDSALHHRVVLWPVCTIRSVFSSRGPVFVNLIDSDGSVVPCGTYPPGLHWCSLELRNWLAIEFVGPPSEEGSDDPLEAIQLSWRVDHRVGERVSSERLTAAVADVPQPSAATRTRHAVMTTLKTMGVMPDEEQMTALEAELEFDFEGDDDFGLYLEMDDNQPFGEPVVEDDDQAPPEPAKPKKKSAESDDPPSAAEPEGSSDDS